MNSYYRFAARTALASGAFGILAYVFLIGFLAIRSGDGEKGTLPIRVHDSCVILQFLFFIPVVIALFKLIRDRSPGLSQLMLNAGVVAVSFTILFLLLIFPKILADTLYMFPQGIFGIWIMAACWHLKGIIPQWLRWFGVIVGFGLALVGIFPLGYAIFVDSLILRIPAPSDEVLDKIPSETSANILIHQFLYIGSAIGVVTLPIWTILIGVRLFKINRSTSDYNLNSSKDDGVTNFS